MKKISLLLLVLAYSLTGLAMEIYVTPGGNGKADGSFKNPLHSIEDARKMARQFLGKETVIIYLNDGIYYLDKTIKFTSEDSGTKKFPVY